ncbi:MAG: hypothetical protein RLP44_16805 [Aggregatilineales bacterium]
MLDSAIIQVAIGLIFIFSLLAILVTQINTFIGNLLKWRSKNLKEGLQHLVTDKKIQAWLLTHPLIDMVQAEIDPRNKLEDQIDRIVDSPVTDVTYIAPDTFVNAIIDILMVEADKLYKPLQEAVKLIGDEETQSRMRELVRSLRSGFSEQTLRDLRSIVEMIPDERARNALIQAINSVEDSLVKLNFKTDQIVPILEGVSKIRDGKFRSALETILVSAKTLDDAKSKLESWFDDGMNRASALFQKRLVYTSLFVSFLVAVTLNVDTLFVSRSLWESPELRQSLAETAIRYDQGSANQIVKPSNNDDVTVAQLREEAEQIGQTVQDLLELQLPIGWEYTEVTEEMITSSRLLGIPDPSKNARNLWNFIPGNSNDWLTIWLQKIIGLLATTIAAAQGAPFWFDLLNRVRGDNNSSNTG